VRRTGKSLSPYLYLHRYHGDGIFITTLLTIGVVEGVGRFLLHGIRYSPLFLIHLVVFAIPFLVLLVVVKFFFNGEQDGSRHRKLVYWCIAEGVGTNVLGTILAFQLF
jgi:hypothetical protein